MTSKPLVSAVVVNWNGSRDLETCLPTLLAQAYRPLEIVVVDNASTDNSAAVVRRFDVNWVALSENRGLAAALNKGAESAQGEFVLFLNNDMRFPEAFVESMVSAIAGDPNIFSVDALQYDWEGEKRVHLATSLARKRAGRIDEQIVPGLYVRQENQDTPTSILMSSAANMLARKWMFQELGGFDERLPIGYEDVELCWRAWIRGWKSVFTPAAVCWHRVGESSSSTEGARIRFRGTLSGRLLTATKLLPISYVIATWMATMGGLAMDLARLRGQRTGDRIKVLRDYAQYFSPLVHERREIYRSGRTNPTEQLERLLQLAIE